MNLVPASPASLQLAAEIIRNGNLVAFPTETVYGLGADALNATACAKIFAAKNRPYFDPLIVHLADLSWLEKLSAQFDERGRRLAEKFWPGPLTLVVPKTDLVPEIVTAGLPSVALRMPNHPLALELLRAAQTPIAAPSANPFGYLSPTTAEHVAEQLGNKIDLILDGGPCPIGVESTILDLTQEKPRLLRPGGLPLEMLEPLVGKIDIYQSDNQRPLAPGLLPSHYAPRTPVMFLNADFKFPADQKAGLLAFQTPIENLPFAKIEILSPAGDLAEAAANLFSCLHRLDRAGLQIIFVEPVPETGLGRAIMDRLRKAAGPRQVE
ncbi:MAG: L-threonylcarbamoyladenylate synthase [candidate division KSB1 bacterium]|nr:L-threonylcarbamoyladenylate synthase [candidate division KSB1 bacterium]MDZ7367299.1 L-threonylcarbamoyladenylate synthase [candidate division KSB1 bacterium]MDZ7405862.1 L-threonylcarbamoyladenylate synthase [candidate division KSB1 bacterium]